MAPGGSLSDGFAHRHEWRSPRLRYSIARDCDAAYPWDEKVCVAVNEISPYTSLDKLTVAACSVELLDT